MSVFAQKHVLVIGDETSQIHDIESALVREGAFVTKSSCEVLQAENLESQKIDIIFLNYLNRESNCKKLLTDMQSDRSTKVIPVFTLVSDNQIDIEQALAFGAADYFTGKETVKSILNKARIVLGESVNSADNTIIDIGQSDLSTKTQGIKVLFVEDDPLLVNLLSLRLEKAEFPFHANFDGKNVLSDMQKFKPDIIILDLMLPGISGFEILTEIRADKQFKNIPVFIFSNRDSAEDKQKAHELSATGFYVKAMTDLSDLIKSIEKTVNGVDGKA